MPARTQNAAYVYEVGKSVQLGERDIPSPKANEVLVKVTSVQCTLCSAPLHPL